MPKHEKGLILKRYSGFYYVQDQEGRVLECHLRGKVKDRAILAGDWVRIELTGDDQGIIEEVLPRKMELHRPAVANVDQIVLVMSFNLPSPNLRLLDRMLVLSEYHGLPLLIVLNKSDIPPYQVVEDIIKNYPLIGYPVIQTSARENRGIDDLLGMMAGHISVLAGPSGVGKSSLLNCLAPGISRRVQEVSTKIGRGRHTTRHVELFPLSTGGWVADTPGFSNLDLPDIKREELASMFIEFRASSEECRFADCLHEKETDCGIKSAVEEGLITASRYQSYLALLEEVKERERYYR